MTDIPAPEGDMLHLPTPDEVELQDLRERYRALGHAVQSGVMAMMNYDPKETGPKSLRTGLNISMCDHSALAQLLMEKKIFTEKEYYQFMIRQLEVERDNYKRRIEDAIQAKTGSRPNISLA